MPMRELVEMDGKIENTKVDSKRLKNGLMSQLAISK